MSPAAHAQRANERFSREWQILTTTIADRAVTIANHLLVGPKTKPA